jgi:2-isopropylmalate synthase
MQRNLKEIFFRLDGAWASFELMSIRKREDYLKPFRVKRCKIDDQVTFEGGEQATSHTEASVVVDIFGTEEPGAATGGGAVHAVDNAMRKVLEKHYPQLSEVKLVEFDVRLLHHGDRWSG